MYSSDTDRQIGLIGLTGVVRARVAFIWNLLGGFNHSSTTCLCIQYAQLKKKKLMLQTSRFSRKADRTYGWKKKKQQISERKNAPHV